MTSGKISWPVLLVCGWLLLGLLTGCTVVAAQPQQGAAAQMTPTTNALFAEKGDFTVSRIGELNVTLPAPTVANYFLAHDTPTPRPSPTPFPTLPIPTPDLRRTQAITATIYSDELDSNWTIVESEALEVDPASTRYIHDGRYAVAATPREDYSQLFFAVSPEAGVAYPRDHVLGVSFWLNGGAGSLAREDLAVTVVGSNAYPYFVAGDDSVVTNESIFFSETRLYYLGINRTIPPDTWTEVIVWLDQLPYDPIYRYVTGVYIKNDMDFRQTFYVDDVNLLMRADGSEPVPSAATPDEATPTATPTPTATSPAPEVTPSATPTTAQEETADATTCTVSPPDGWAEHTVAAGEAISNLAVASGRSIDYVLEVNCLDINDIVSVGQVIWLPIQSETGQSSPPIE